MKEIPRIVILGAGFGGLRALRVFSRSLPAEKARIILIERNNYHTFFPLLYQVAAAELNPEEIVYPVRGILRRRPGAEFIMGNVNKVDPAAKRIELDGLSIGYDYLILAMGSVTNYYGVPGAEENSFGLKTMEEAIRIRNHILTCFEKASLEADEKRKTRLLTFVIVGGGATGVEFAGSLSELIRGSVMRDYRGSKPGDIRVHMLEREGALLSGFPAVLQRYALRRLTRMGVEVHLKSPVKEVAPGAVILENMRVISTDTVVWMAGVQGVPAARIWGFRPVQAGRLETLPTLQDPGHPETYIVGDLAFAKQDGAFARNGGMPLPQGGQKPPYPQGGQKPPFPMIAPVAIQQGAWAARNIIRQIRGEEPVPFRYRDKGAMVTIGRNAAAVYFKGRSFTGFSAWVLWLIVHLWYLIGFPNRFLVLFHWAMDYFFYERVVRLILPREEERNGRA